jgi:hypothetical protein
MFLRSKMDPKLGHISLYEIYTSKGNNCQHVLLYRVLCSTLQLGKKETTWPNPCLAVGSGQFLCRLTDTITQSIIRSQRISPYPSLYFGTEFPDRYAERANRVEGTRLYSVYLLLDHVTWPEYGWEHYPSQIIPFMSFHPGPPRCWIDTIKDVLSLIQPDRVPLLPLCHSPSLF